MDDPAIAALLRDGDPEGLSQLYDRYAGRLYAFCLTVVRDPSTAQDVVRDTLIIAYQRAGQLRDPGRLRPWLYALARNECLRQLRRQRRSTALEEAGDVPAEIPDPATDLRARDLQKLVWRAAEGLNPRERAAIELSVRHGLAGRDLADALGVTVNHAQTLLTRARQQLERGLSALLVGARPQDCPELAGIVADWDGRLTVLMRKRIGRHVEACATCAARKAEQVSATALLAATPLPVLPVVLREEFFGGTPSGAAPGHVDGAGQPERAERPAAPGQPDPGDVAAVVGRAGPFDRDGFPREDRGRRTAAAAVLALLLGVGTALFWPGTDPTTRLTDLAAGLSLDASTSPPAQGGGQARRRASASPSPAAPAPGPTGGTPATAYPSKGSVTTAPPPPAPGTLSFADNPVELGALAEKSTTIQAVDGAVSWTATPGAGWEDWLSISPQEGSLSAGQSRTVTIRLTRQNNNDAGSGTIVFRIKGGGTRTLTVTWSKPIG